MQIFLKLNVYGSELFFIYFLTYLFFKILHRLSDRKSCCKTLFTFSGKQHKPCSTGPLTHNWNTFEVSLLCLFVRILTYWVLRNPQKISKDSKIQKKLQWIKILCSSIPAYYCFGWVESPTNHQILLYFSIYCQGYILILLDFIKYFR